MKMNVGSVDRVIRFFLGACGVTTGYFLQSTIVGVIGAILLLTGVVGLCPLYSLLMVNTCGKKSE